MYVYIYLLIPEKICCNMLFGRCSPVYPVHFIFNIQSERPRCFFDTQRTFQFNIQQFTSTIITK